MIEYENLQKVNIGLFDEYKEEFDKLLQSGWYVLGNNVKNFESQFSKFCESQYCAGVASGLDALIIALDAFNFKKGSEVLVPSNTYIATILAIVRCGLCPVLVEPNIKTYNIDPNKIEESISNATVAIIAVHLYGKSCDMDTIVDLSKKYNLEIIEDCAQAHGAKYKEKTVGSFGVGCFSFYPTKNLGALGDAGAICSNNIEYDDKVRSLRNYGSSKKYHNDDLGYNSRLDEIQASFLSVKLKIIDNITTHKRRLASLYLEHLSDDFIKPVVDQDFFDVYHIFNIRIDSRDNLKEYLIKNKIMTEIHYPVPPHKQKALNGLINQSYPISEEIHNTTLSLPISYSHTESDIEKVIETMNRYTE
jgi:dTDP-4-amino-4,6-dideoxygalactose transaminase